MAIYITVNGREFFRVREALAGCRGAALTRVFVMPSRARYYKHTSCPRKCVPSRCCGFRAQRRTSHVALAECILAYYVGTDANVSEVLHVAGEKRQHRRVSRICDTGDIPLPRSLTRYARSFDCGERCQLTQRR